MKQTLKLSSLAFCLTLLSPQVFAENHLIVLGGGGEPKGKTTIFDGDIKAIGQNATFKDWKKTVIFNGGHSETEKLVKQTFRGADIKPRFDKNNYDQFLKTTIDQIKNGKIKPGDQVLVNFITHGAPQEKGKELTHQIALSGGAATNLSNLAGASTVSLDTLQQLIDVADQKGIKLGITNFSCFSGNLLNLKTRSACLIAQSIPESYSMATPNSTNPRDPLYNKVGFARNFFESIKKGSSLEDVYLEGRGKNKLIDYPLISTAAGENTNKMLLDKYKEVVDVTNIFGPIYGTHLPDVPASNKIAIGDYEKQFSKYTCAEVNQLENFLDLSNFDKVLKAMNTKQMDLETRNFHNTGTALSKHLKETHKVQMNIIRILKEFEHIWKTQHAENYQKMQPLSITALMYGVGGEYILEQSEQSIEAFNLPREAKELMKEMRLAALKIVNKVDIYDSIALRKYPKLMAEMRDKELELLLEFQAASTTLYNRIYENQPKQASNNCANFKF